MREKVQKQMPLIEPAGSHPQEKELESISRSLIVCLLFVSPFCKISITVRSLSGAPEQTA
jgi:hypothetical protein